MSLPNKLLNAYAILLAIVILLFDIAGILAFQEPIGLMHLGIIHF